MALPTGNERATPEQESEAIDRLLLILDGLVPLHLMRLDRPGELARTHAEATAQDGLADRIAEAGDRLTAPGNFRDPEDRRIRGRLLGAMATCLALGAHQPGGITWAGRHWCTAPHTNCPKTRPAVT
jgi:hypothetical protein